MTYDNRNHNFTSQYNHKIFMHINAWTAGVLPYIEALRPKIIKTLDPNVDNLRRIRELVPDALIIYRRWVPDQPLGSSWDSAYQFGVNFASEFILSEPAVQLGLVDLCEGYNERLGETESDLVHRRFDRFHIGMLDQLTSDGLPVKPIAFNFGTGNMSGEQIMRVYPDTLERYQWLGFHEYDWPFMNRLHEQGLAEGNGGMWLALRYRRIMEELINTFGDNWSVLVTECGMTQSVHAGAQNIGWQHSDNTVSGPWSSHPTPILPTDYFNTLLWYSSEMMADRYVAGACHFVTGATADWQSFEIVDTEVQQLLADYQEEITEPPINGGNGEPPMDEIFVDDVRAADDSSLDLVQRIENFEQLQTVFGLEVDLSLGEELAQNGEHYWRLIGFEVRTGIASYLPQVQEADGTPSALILVWRRWPDAETQPEGVISPAYFGNQGDGGFTDGSGVRGSPYGGGSVTGPDGGPDSLWCNDDTKPGGARVGSDLATKLGWIGGTDHLTANPIFRDVIKGDSDNGEPPISGDLIELKIGGITVYKALLTITAHEIV